MTASCNWRTVAACCADGDSARIVDRWGTVVALGESGQWNRMVVEVPDSYLWPGRKAAVRRVPRVGTVARGRLKSLSAG
jgi:hypothetical protein